MKTYIQLFEDTRVHQLAPVTTGRTACSIGCGAERLIDVALSEADGVASRVRVALAELHHHDCPVLKSTDELIAAAGEQNIWLINARLAPKRDLFTVLAAVRADREAESLILMSDESLVAAYVPGNSVRELLGENDLVTDEAIAGWLDRQAAPSPMLRSLSLFGYPHDIIREHAKLMTVNLERRARLGDLTEIDNGVFAGDDVHLPKYWHPQTKEGPIVLDHGSRVGPFAVLEGPVYVGRNAQVKAHAMIGHQTALGHTTKVGGEVEASIIEPYTNKQHYGFLGHSYVGSWVNLGAGTCNSDLKNTYGHVRVVYDGVKVDTEMQFLGCIIGDYAKTAINASIFTGKRIGTASMVYGQVTEDVPAFVNYTGRDTVTEVDVPTVNKMQERMFGRRKLTQTDMHLKLIQHMFDTTVDARIGITAGPPAF